MVRTCLIGLVALSACVARAPADTSFQFEARPTAHVIHVLPTLAVYAEPELRVDGYVTDPIPWVREALRRERMEDLESLTTDFGIALPGALGDEVREVWSGRFVADGSRSGSDRITAALVRGAGLDEALASATRRRDGEMVLFSWVSEIEAIPVTSEAPPGEVLDTDAGPVVVDLLEEALRVRAEVGMALVSSDGEVVMRYSDRFESVLSSDRTVSRVGRDIARGLAAEVALLWPGTVPRSVPIREMAAVR